MRTHCAYCGKETADGARFCSADCAAKYEQALETGAKNQRGLFIGLLLSLLVILAGPVSGNEPMVGIGVAILGFVVARWPFALAETVRNVGYAWSRQVCRAIGVTIIPVGLISIFMI